MTINERIQYLRKSVLKMNQRQFAASLGMSQTGISGMERSGATVPDSTIKLICATHNISESWLRTGEGSIVEESETFSLDEYAASHGCTDLDIAFLKAFFDLDPDMRNRVLDHFQKSLAKRQPPPAAPTDAEARMAAME